MSNEHEHDWRVCDTGVYLKTYKRIGEMAKYPTVEVTVGAVCRTCGVIGTRKGTVDWEDWKVFGE